MTIDARFGLAGGDYSDLSLLGLGTNALAYQWPVLQNAPVQMIGRPRSLHPNDSQPQDSIPYSNNYPYYPQDETVFHGPASVCQWAQSHPGMTYIIGNEPDDSGQDNIPWWAWGRLISAVYTVLRTWDPTCKIIIGALGGTANPFGYLDNLLQSYSDTLWMADGWTVHAYHSTPDGSIQGFFTGFKIVLQNYQAFVARHGLENKTHWLTEWCMSAPGSWADQAEFMRLTTDYLKNQSLISKWAWFIGRSYVSSPFHGWNNHLVSPEGIKTAAGIKYKQLAQGLSIW